MPNNENNITIAQEYQNLLYGLLQEHITDMDEVCIRNPETGMDEAFVAKSVLADRMIDILNDFGEMMAEDRRLTDEIDSGESCPVSEES